MERLPPDPVLPGLSIALDPEALGTELRARLPECLDGAEPCDLVAVDVQYRPGEAATVLVRLKLKLDGHTIRAQIFVLVLPLQAAPPVVEPAVIEAYRLRRRQPGGVRQLPLREPVQHWADLGLHLHAFPVDARLPGLSAAVDPKAVRQALDRAWQPRGVRVHRVDVSLMSYTPESRAALRYDVLSVDKTTGLPEIRRLVGKIQRRRPPEELFAGHWAVWRATLGRVRLAPPVGHLGSSGLTLQELLEARRLSDLAGKGSFNKGVRATARAIATVNSTVLALPSLRDAAKECRTVSRWVRMLTRLRPAMAARLKAHGARLSSELELRFRARGTVHSDFHLANVMVNSRGVTLIDWDQVAHGDPALDPGRFLGALRIAALRVTGTPNGLAEAGELFLETYLERSGEAERQVRLFESLALMIASASPFRLQREGWQEQAELLFAESELALERSLKGPPLAVTSASPRPLPLSVRRDWAMDRSYAGALLSELVRASVDSGIDVTECVPSLQQETEEVLRLRWALKGWRSGKRWRLQLDGVGIAGHTGTALERRLRLLHAAAGNSRAVLELPRPLGHLAPISLIVLERGASRSLERRLGSEEEGALLERLGVALAALAALELELDKERSPLRVAEGTFKRIDLLAEREHAATGELRRQLERALAALGDSSDCRTATPRGLAFADLVFDDERVGARLIRDLVAAPTGALVADLLCQLETLRVRGKASIGSVARLRDAFLAAAGLEERDIAGQEALTLIDKACRLYLSRPNDKRAAELLHLASARIELVS